jgi:hypothetical protein
MASLSKEADILIPNITEAAFMLGTEYRENYDENYVKSLLLGLAEQGSKRVALTGISLNPDKIGFMAYDSGVNEFYFYENEKLPVSFHGTGDIFASATVGALMRGLSFQELTELFHGTEPVADGILDVIAQFGKGKVVTFGNKDWVVTESGTSSLFSDDFTFYNAFEQVFLSVENEADSGTELCFPVFHPFQFFQKFLHIGFRIVSVASISGREYSGCTIQGFHFESGIIGKAIHAVVLINVHGFLAGIAFQGIGCFRNVGKAFDVLQTQQFHFIAQDSSDFFQFMCVVGSNY